MLLRVGVIKAERQRQDALGGRGGSVVLLGGGSLQRIGAELRCQQLVDLVDGAAIQQLL
ncbi:hypothetical protein D3C72_2360340 [compost metagenome]